MNVALLFLLIVTIICICLGLLARKNHNMNLEEWSVGGRSFGAALVFLLMAGEIFIPLLLFSVVAVLPIVKAHQLIIYWYMLHSPILFLILSCHLSGNMLKIIK